MADIDSSFPMDRVLTEETRALGVKPMKTAFQFVIPDNPRGIV